MVAVPVAGLALPDSLVGGPLYIESMFGIRLTLSDETQDRLVEASRARARAEWVQWDALVRAAAELHAQIDGEECYTRRLVYRSAVAATLAVKCGLSKGQVEARLALAQRVKEATPAIWEAFEEGRIDEARVRELSSAILKLKRPRSLERLQHVGLAYAEKHDVSELRSWVKRFVARIEPEGFNARADEARRQRYVKIIHGDDGMSFIDAYVPSFVAAAVDNRLDARATEIAAAGDPDDERTKAQRRADSFSEWLLSADHAPASLNIDVALMLPATALTGSSGVPAESADGQWGIPASWAIDEFMKHSPFWHRMIIDPVNNDVLAHEYLGRFAPDVLRRAICFRDRTCRGPGCCKPASRSEMDHRQPWPEGRTSGDNIWPLCKSDHNHKGHGILQWVMPDGQIIPVDKPDYALAS
jgi:hypothetical protein